ncbi:hypothetical protein Tco_0347495 [Tanacetum coccineum]
MANILKDVQCARFDTRPPMLDRTDFASWQQRIRLYCRARVYSDLSPEDKDRYNADIHATNILLQGLPKDIYTLINHYTDAKDIWDNVKMLLEGSKLTKEDRESQLYDDFEHIRQNKGETIHDYYVRFAKLINDMQNIKMTMSRMQLNSKFVNNMLPEWGRFITTVKLNRGLRDSNYDQLYAYLKQHEAHANENKMMLDRFTQHTVDPLALMSNNRGQGNNARGAGAAGYGGAQNRVGNSILGQARQIKCYNCNVYKTHRDEDVDEQPVQDLALNVDNVFQAEDYDAFDSDVDEGSQHKAMSWQIYHPQICMMEVGRLMDSEHTNLSLPIVLLEQHRTLEQKIDEQLRIVITDRNIKKENLKKELHSVKMQLAFTINHNKSMVEEVTSLKKDFKQKENKYLEEFLDMKALKEKNKVAIGYKNPLCLTRAKQVQPVLYNGHEIIKTNHVPAIVHNSEDTLEIAEITRKKMSDKMNDPECVKKKVKIAPPDYSKENYLATFTPQKQLTPEQIFWSNDLIKMKAEALKKQTTTS